MTNKTVDESDEVQLAPTSRTRQPGSHTRTPSDWNRRARTFDLRPPLGLYEHLDQEPLSRWEFGQRMVRHVAVAGAIVFVSALFGTWGYHRFADFTFGESFLNAAMMLSGNGPVEFVQTHSAKLFSALFALYSQMIFLVLIATILTPVIHRVLHRFHWDTDRHRAGAGSSRRPPD